VSEKKYKFDEASGFVLADGLPFCEPLDVNRRTEHGELIVSALNNREEKEAAILKEREEIIAMLTDGSYCRASEHKRNICVCPEFRADIRARSIPE
jgi:hypothetical protein